MFSKDYFVPVLCLAAAEIKRPWNIVFFYFLHPGTKSVWDFFPIAAVLADLNFAKILFDVQNFAWREVFRYAKFSP